MNSPIKNGGLIGIMAIFIVSFVLSVSLTYADTSKQGSYGPNYDCNGGINSNSSGPTFVPLACYSGSPIITNAFNSGNLPDYINNVFKIILSVGGIIAVLRIAYGGYMYMGSADMWGNKQAAKEAIGDAIIGLVLLTGIYLILYQINPGLLNLNILQDINPITNGTSQTQVTSTDTTNSNSNTFHSVGGLADGSHCNNGGTIINAVCSK